MFDKLALVDDSTEMTQAINAKTFYVVATPLVSGYSIGSMDSNLPAVYATLDEAIAENKDMTDSYASDIERGDRDEDDYWDGEVVMAHWDGGDNMTLATLCGEHLITTRAWREMAGY